MRAPIAILLLLLASPAPAQTAAEERSRAEREGRASYLRLCATCHGVRGDGRGPTAPFLTTAPRDFTRGEYRWRSTREGLVPPVEDLERTIREGVRGTEMPSWSGALSPSRIRILALYVRTFSDRFWTRAPPPAPEPLPAPPPGDPGAIVRGRELFATMGCVGCHGPEGRGDGRAAAELRTSAGKPIRPADLTRGFFKGGSGPGAVYRAISTGLEGTPMAAFAGALSPEQRWDLAVYVASLGRRAQLLDRLLSDSAGRVQARSP